MFSSAVWKIGTDRQTLFSLLIYHFQGFNSLKRFVEKAAAILFLYLFSIKNLVLSLWFSRKHFNSRKKSYKMGRGYTTTQSSKARRSNLIYVCKIWSHTFILTFNNSDRKICWKFLMIVNSPLSFKTLEKIAWLTVSVWSSLTVEE